LSRKDAKSRTRSSWLRDPYLPLHTFGFYRESASRPAPKKISQLARIASHCLAPPWRPRCIGADSILRMNGTRREPPAEPGALRYERLIRLSGTVYMLTIRRLTAGNCDAIGVLHKAEAGVIVTYTTPNDAVISYLRAPLRASLTAS
jgi:hypothetical protein